MMSDARADGLRLAIFTDTYPPQVNGVARTLARLAQAIEQRGGAVRIVTIADPGASSDAGPDATPDVTPDATPDSQVERWPSIPFWAYPQLRIAAPSRQRALDLIDQWKPNLVHVATEFGVGLAGLFAAEEAGVPVVTSYHTHFKAYLEFYNLSALGPVAWPYLRWFHNRGRRTFAPSGIVARELEQMGFENMRVWSRGVDGSRFSPSFRSEAMRAHLGVTRPDQVVVSYVGRLAREKDLIVLMRAMHTMRERAGDRVVFAIVGDGPAEAECRAAAPTGTVFTGKLTGRELAAAYASADIFAFPSITETFGNVVLEAMASGLAVVAPDIGATTEYATPETAVQFRAKDAESFAGQLLRLVDDSALRARIAASGLAFARATTWDSIFDRLVRDYRDVVASAQASLPRSATKR